jgi:hypothetical protein
MSETLAHEETYGIANLSSPFPLDILDQLRYSDYVRNTRDRFQDLVAVITDLNAPSRKVELSLH